MSDEENRSTSSAVANLRKSAGEQIRLARDERGWSQAKLAQEAGTSQQTIDRIERGVTQSSRAYPKIMKALGLNGRSGPVTDFVNYLDSPTQEDIDREARLRAAFGPGEPSVDALVRNGQMPIYARVESEIPGEYLPHLVLIDAVPRLYPVALVEAAYGLMISSNDMRPAYRSGDIAIINPVLPLNRDCDIALFDSKRPSKFHVRSLIRETEEAWIVQQWHPQKEVSLPKSEWVVAKMVVARISRYR